MQEHIRSKLRRRLKKQKHDTFVDKVPAWNAEIRQVEAEEQGKRIEEELARSTKKQQSPEML